MTQTVDQSAIDNVYQSFSFLEKDWGYVRTEGYQYSNSVYTRSNYVIKYLNHSLKKQIEVALLVPGYLVEIALIRFSDKGIIHYNDENYCLSYTKLFYLLRPPIFERVTYSFSESERFEIIQNAANVISFFKDVLCSNIWFNVEKIGCLYQECFSKKWGVNLVNPKNESVPDEIRKKLIDLIAKEYYLKQDSNNLPFYARNGWFVTYSNNEIEITVSQIDMRDYLDYNLDINNIKKTFSYRGYNSAGKFANDITHFINEQIC